MLRSVTRVDDALLEGAHALRFVGSATSGTDHMELDCLARRGIAWAAAPGSNAAAVADYVIAALCQQEEGFPLGAGGRTVGLVGCGHIGGELRRRLERLGWRCLISDPPRAAELPSRPLAELLSTVDILSLHLPLSADTCQLLDAVALARLRPGALLINTSRGALLSTRALLERTAAPGAPRLVLDTWEGEPSIDARLVARARIATPHIAGHSPAARHRALRALRSAVGRHFGLPDAPPGEGLMAAVEPLELSAADGADAPALLRRLSAHCCPVAAMDRQLRSALAAAPGDSASGFAAARAAPPPRVEFSELPLLAAALPSGARRMLCAAGFAPRPRPRRAG